MQSTLITQTKQNTQSQRILGFVNCLYIYSAKTWSICSHCRKMEKAPGSLVLRATPFFCLLLLCLLYTVDFGFNVTRPSDQCKPMFPLTILGDKLCHFNMLFMQKATSFASHLYNLLVSGKNLTIFNGSF